MTGATRTTRTTASTGNREPALCAVHELCGVAFFTHAEWLAGGVSLGVTKLIALVWVGLALATQAQARQIEFNRDAATDPAVLAEEMPRLARSVLALYRESDREKYLDSLFRLQLVAGDYAGAGASLASLRELRDPTRPQPAVGNVRWEIYAKALSRQAARQESFDEAFKQSFREAFNALDNQTAFQVQYTFGTSLNRLEANLRQALDQQKGKATIVLPDALALVRSYLAVQAYRRFQPLVPQLSDEDDQRRYVIAKDILVRTPDGASVCATTVRPRETRRLPALLNFTIYADPFRTTDSARLTAAHGYVGVAGLTRGKGCSPDRPVPVEHDGSDAAALIDWISRQPWSDGRVGMYGGSYDGFTQWAAAKHLPKALKAIMPSVTFAPGIDFPNPGGIFQSYGFPWPFYTTGAKTLDHATYNDSERWNRLFRDWYTSGRAYRELDKIDGTANPIWNRWLAHPSYDSYWQRMIPYGEEFARLDIPVLTTTGYYDDGQIGALHYFTQHYKHKPNAEHYLVIGPYDHVSGQWGTRAGPDGTLPPLLGYKPDPISALDIVELRYQWFDYVLKGGPKPALLKDRVNYEVMGANVWRHAPSLAAMADRRLKFLSERRACGRHVPPDGSAGAHGLHPPDGQLRRPLRRGAYEFRAGERRQLERQRDYRRREFADAERLRVRQRPVPDARRVERPVHGAAGFHHQQEGFRFQRPALRAEARRRILPTVLPLGASQLRERSQPPGVADTRQERATRLREQSTDEPPVHGGQPIGRRPRHH